MGISLLLLPDKLLQTPWLKTPISMPDWGSKLHTEVLARLGFSFGGLGEDSAQKLIQLFFNIHFLVVVGLKSPLSCCYLEHAAPNAHLHFCHVPTLSSKPAREKFSWPKSHSWLKYILLPLRWLNPHLKGSWNDMRLNPIVSLL